MKVVTTETSRYYIPDERPDLKLPSVTSIIGALSDKSGIEKWRKDVGEEAADRISKFAANRGTFLHLLCENYLRKRYEEGRGDTKAVMRETFNETMADPDIMLMDRMMLIAGKTLFMNMYREGIFNSIKSVVIQEVGLWSIISNAAGRVDLIARDHDDNLITIDFKSSTSPKKEEYIDGYYLQISAYSFMYYERFGEMPLKGKVWISNEQNEVIQVFELSFNEMKSYYKRFVDMSTEYHKTI